MYANSVSKILITYVVNIYIYIYTFALFYQYKNNKHIHTYSIAVELQYDDHFEVGRPHEIICNLYTGKVVNSDNVSISWNGPNGVIANESSRITVIPTTSDGHIHTSILQFLYISEEDENTSYNCTASLPGENESVSESFTINNLSSELNYYYLCMKVTQNFSYMSIIIIQAIKY